MIRSRFNRVPCSLFRGLAIHPPYIQKLFTPFLHPKSLYTLPNPKRLYTLLPPEISKHPSYTQNLYTPCLHPKPLYTLPTPETSIHPPYTRNLYTPSPHPKPLHTLPTPETPHPKREYSTCLMVPPFDVCRGTEPARGTEPLKTA